MKILEREISEIIPYSKNAKKHDKKQVEKIANSIKEFGFNQPVVVDKDNVVIVGHGRLEAAHYLKMTKVPVLQVDLPSDKAKAYRLADNKLNESDWDMDLVIEELKSLDLAGFNISLTGFDKDLILTPQKRDDDIPESAPPISKLGDIYILGGVHRVMCGDSTSLEQVAKLMDGNRARMCFTDPPYNINYTGGMSTHDQNKREGIKNDNMSKEDFLKFMRSAMIPIVKNTDGGIYIAMSSSELDSLKKAFEEAGGHWQSYIIWAKNNFTLSRADYQNTYEPMLYGWRDGLVNHYFSERRDIANVWEDLSKVKTEYDGEYTTISFQGFKVKVSGKVEKGEVIKKKQSTDIWRHDKPSVSELHPTQKPVALVQEAITNSSKENDIVLDTFLGSGSTLIASVKTNRICYGMELDPKFVDVIVQRYVEYTGDNQIIKNGASIKWAK